MTRYRSFTQPEFEALMEEMQFGRVRVEGALELVYERVIHNGPFPSQRFAVRIFSTVDVRTGVARENGGDAIRVMLVDRSREKPVLDWSVHRTQNAFANTRARAREAWAYVMQAAHHCPDCSALMVERKGKKGGFLGCTAFPVCKSTAAVVRA